MEMYETYETEEDASETYCENDLELAAELGKALLERNRELESQLQHQHHLYHEQTLQLQHVTKQLDSFRSMSESRNRVYEEMDRISQDLERQNNKLNMQVRADHQKIDRLTGTVETLEQKVEDLHKQLEEAKKRGDNKSNQAKKQEKRRTASWASLDSRHHDSQSFYLGDLTWTQTAHFKKLPLNPWEGELLKLQDSLQHLRTQFNTQRHHTQDLEVQLDVSQQENSHLLSKVKVLEDRLSEAMLLEYELEQAKRAQQAGLCGQCRRARDGVQGGQVPESSLLSEVEHDEDPPLISQARAVKLEGGESLYGSSESINKVSSDASEIKASESKSILDELETQYKSLFSKYENLMSNKINKTMQTDQEEERAMRRRLQHKEVQTLLHETLNRDYSSQDTQPPPYRALFQDLFATLRKSRLQQENP